MCFFQFWFSQCVCPATPHLLCPFLCQWTFRLLPCLGYCKQCCNEHWDICILLDHALSLDVCPRVGFQGHMVALLLALWGTSILFSIVAVSIYIPTNSTGELPSLQHLFLVSFLLITILACMRWYFIVVLTFISLILRDVEHLFMCLSAFCMSSLEEISI